MSMELPSDPAPQENGLPSLSNLGSLAQSARAKQLKVARNIMLIVGVLTILFNVFMLANTKNEVEDAIKDQVKAVRAHGMQEDPASVQEFRVRATRICHLIYGALVVLGAVYVILGLLVHAYPVPATVLGLVLYIGSAAILGYLNPLSLAQGWLWKIIIVVALAKSIQAAVAYQRG